MADNVRITRNANATPADGTIIATDEVSGVQYQIMKLAIGDDGEATLVSSDSPIPTSSAITQKNIETQELINLLQEMIMQQKVTNFLLNVMNDSNITTHDV